MRTVAPRFPTCGQIKVGAISRPGTGIEFASDFLAASDCSVSFDDATIHYHVNSPLEITNVGLAFDGNFFGRAIASVTESIFDSTGAMVGFGEVACGAYGVGGQMSTLIINLEGFYNDLYIVKDISVVAFPCGLPSLSYIDQTFDPVPTPEPASIALLGAGLVGVATLVRRRHKTAKV